MTVGIYKLAFTGTDKCYIGQSSRVEGRYTQHIHSLETNKANVKMMGAYYTYGLPRLEILCECSIEELDSIEEEAIQIFDSVNNGFNIYSSSKIAPTYSGENHPRSKYTNEKILEAARLLTDASNTGLYVSSVTGMPLTIIQDISSLKVHNWIKEIDPVTYKALEVLKGNRKNAKGIAKRGTIYPPVLSPSGIIHDNIQNLMKFCEEHNLHRSNFRKLLKGKIKTSLGWRLLKDG